MEKELKRFLALKGIGESLDKFFINLQAPKTDIRYVMTKELLKTLNFHSLANDEGMALILKEVTRRKNEKREQ